MAMLVHQNVLSYHSLEWWRERESWAVCSQCFLGFCRHFICWTCKINETQIETKLWDWNHLKPMSTIVNPWALSISCAFAFSHPMALWACRSLIVCVICVFGVLKGYFNVSLNLVAVATVWILKRFLTQLLEKGCKIMTYQSDCLRSWEVFFFK